MQYFFMGSGKIVVMHLRKGEQVLETITEQFREMGVKNAVLMSGIGSLRRLSLHYIIQNDEEPNVYVDMEDAVEIGSMQGTIIDGEPHIHIACSAASAGKCYMGHLENGCEVQYLLELAFLIIDDQRELTRKTDENGITYIGQK